ncbi:MAG: hypothetical protein BWY72_02151 [Bacteroidetes bacterium ADurb.Bin416]|nr:MAG: hypothetical protein BWY72_02151 [Bacteroidetes bacterium ADurb.Bin416]
MGINGNGAAVIFYCCEGISLFYMELAIHHMGVHVVRIAFFQVGEALSGIVKPLGLELTDGHVLHERFVILLKFKPFYAIFNGSVEIFQTHSGIAATEEGAHHEVIAFQG